MKKPHGTFLDSSSCSDVMLRKVRAVATESDSSGLLQDSKIRWLGEAPVVQFTS